MAKVAARILARGGLESIQAVEDIGSGVDVGRRALGAVHAHFPRRAFRQSFFASSTRSHSTISPSVVNSLRLFSGEMSTDLTFRW